MARFKIGRNSSRLPPHSRYFFTNLMVVYDRSGKGTGDDFRLVARYFVSRHLRRGFSISGHKDANWQSNLGRDESVGTDSRPSSISIST